MSNEAAVANPSTTTLGAAAGPLGYLTLGITLLAYGLLASGVIHGTAAVDARPFALLLGGVALFITGLLEFRAGSAVSGTAFAVLGAFWVIWGQGGAWPANASGLFLALFALVVLTLTLAHGTSDLLVRAAYALFTVSLALSAVAVLAGSSDLGKVGAWFAVAAGAVSWYRATAALSSTAQVRLPIR